MRAALPFLLAAVLGVAAAALVACGSSADSRRDLIPDRSADRLKTALTSVRRAVDDGDCIAAARAVSRARGILVNLPSAVDDRLVSALRQGLDNLEQVGQRECRQQDTQTETQPTTSTTTPDTTPTTPTATTTTPTTPTTPTDTSTTPTTPTTGTGTGTTAPPDTTPTTPPAGDTTGGTTTP